VWTTFGAAAFLGDLAVHRLVERWGWLAARPSLLGGAVLMLAATLAERLGIEQAADALIDLGERAGAYRPGRKLLTLVHSMLAGADCIDADLLRCGATSQVLGHRVMAPSTLGTFLRAFTFGTSASSTGSPSKSLPGRGRPALSAHAVLAGG
jgi:hypothetical protein